MPQQSSRQISIEFSIESWRLTDISIRIQKLIFDVVKFMKPISKNSKPTGIQSLNHEDHEYEMIVTYKDPSYETRYLGLLKKGRTYMFGENPADILSTHCGHTQLWLHIKPLLFLDGEQKQDSTNDRSHYDVIMVEVEGSDTNI